MLESVVPYEVGSSTRERMKRSMNDDVGCRDEKARHCRNLAESGYHLRLCLAQAPRIFLSATFRFHMQNPVSSSEATRITRHASCEKSRTYDSTVFTMHIS